MACILKPGGTRYSTWCGKERWYSFIWQSLAHAIDASSWSSIALCRSCHKAARDAEKEAKA